MEADKLLHHAGLRHVALYCTRLEETVRFYTGLLGMKIEWNPDPDNYYLTSGNDNLALHRADTPPGAGQRLDHIGFLVDRAQDVDAWHARLSSAGVAIVAPPKTHRDGARSFYCKDPDGTTVQVIHHPPLARP
jgi:catechol 2,3-dioxygenase-like lactoylglutathione lyase family enzyme